MAINPLKEQLMSIGRPIAERTLCISGSDEAVYVRLGEPQPFPDGQDWYCPYEVITKQNKVVRFAAGVDALQALQLALKGISSQVFVLNRDLDHKLRWLGGTELGFVNYDGEEF
jgi:hypothetical protein